MISQWTLSVIPTFVMMGLLLTKSGITARVYAAAQQWFVGACLLFGEPERGHAVPVGHGRQVLLRCVYVP